MTNTFYDHSLLGQLERHASECPEQTVYTFLRDDSEPETLTFGELAARVRTTAARLGEQLRPGDRAMLLYPQGLEFLCAFLGCLAAGVIAVPSYPHRGRRTSDRLNGICADCSPAAILTQASPHGAPAGLDGIAVLRTDEWPTGAAPPWNRVHVQSEAVAFLQYTSGSTAAPKGVMVTHGNIAVNERQIERSFGHRRSDGEHEPPTVLSWLPLFHDMGLIGGALQPLYAGFPAVLMPPTTFLQQPVKWLQAVSRYKATTTGAPNFAYEHCVRSVSEEEKRDLDLSSLRVLYNGAEPVRGETLDRFAQAFACCGFNSRAFFPCYGLAEATLFVSGGPRDEAPKRLHINSAALECGRIEATDAADPQSRCFVACGPPAMGTDVIIVDPTARLATAAGKVGEIWIKSGSVAKGYWNRPDDSEATFGSRLADSGDGPFLATGDLGFIDSGNLYVTGRLKEVIVFRGRNIYPQDIEAAVAAEVVAIGPNACAAVAVDAGDTEGIALVVEANVALARVARSADKDNVGARAAREEFEKVAAGIRRRVSDEFEAPVRKVVVVRPGTFPRTTSGKVQRAACRERLLTGTHDAIYSWELGSARCAKDGERGMAFDGSAEPLMTGKCDRTPSGRDGLDSRSSEGTQAASGGRATGRSREAADQIIAWLRDYAGRKLNSRVIDERRCVPPNIVLDLGFRGLLGLQAPREHGGAALTTTDTLRVFEQLAAIDLTLCIMVGIHNGLGLRPLQRFARTTEISELLPLLASGRQLAAFALTESAAGSNPNAIETTARRDGDGWVLRGEKRWIGLASWAGIITCFAKALDTTGRADGFVALAVREDTRGVRHGPESLTMGVRGIVQSRLFFDDVRVPDAFRLGEFGNGMAIAQDAMMFCRLGLAAVSVGGMKRCAQLAARYAARRMISTGRLIDNSLTISRLEDMVAAAAATEALVVEVASWLDDGQDVPATAYVACKTNGPELLGHAADALMQLLGGRGYEENGPAPQLFRDARLLRIFEGPTETLNTFLGSHVFDCGDEITDLIGDRLQQPRLAADLGALVERIKASAARNTNRHAHLVGEITSAAILAAAANKRAPVSEVASEASRWASERFTSMCDAAARSIERKTKSSGALLRHVADLSRAIGDVEQTLRGAEEELDPLLRIDVPAIGPGRSLAESHQAAAAVGGNGAAGPYSDELVVASIRAALLGWMRREVGPSREGLDDHTPFTSLGLDSIAAATVALDIEKATGVRVGPEAIYQHPTVALLAEYVVRRAETTDSLPTTAGVAAAPSGGSADGVPSALNGRSENTAPATARAGLKSGLDYVRVLDECHRALTSGHEVSDVIWRLCSSLCSVRARSSKTAWKAITAKCREHSLIQLLHQDPYAARAFAKPRGYPGDAGIIDYVYRASPSLEERRSLTPLGSAILQATTSLPSARAVRERKRFAASQIDIVAGRKGRPTIMAVGAGHAREVALSAALREGHVGRFLALDQDERSLDVVRNEYGSMGIECIECLPVSVRDLLQGPRPAEQVDLIYALGLYDYLTEPVAQRLTAVLVDILAPDGTLLIANLVPDIIEAGYMEAIADWYLTYRTAAELERLAIGLGRSEVASYDTWVDDLRCVAYLSITKAPSLHRNGPPAAASSREIALSAPVRIRDRTGRMEHAATPSTTVSRCEDFGCRVNEIEVVDLFRRYREVGFLHSAKTERLAPYFDEIIDNWRKMVSAGTLLHWIVTKHDDYKGGSASLTCWRTTARGMFAQHLISTGEPAITRDVLLGALAEGMVHGQNDIAAQNWFSEDNRAARRVFGAVPDAVRAGLCAIRRYTLMDVPLGRFDLHHEVFVRRGGPEDGDNIYRLAVESRGAVYADAEELRGPDIELHGLNELYGKVGLFRYRRIWVASLRGEEALVGAVVAYRGPLGLNFSFLENRCDVLIRPELPERLVTAVVDSLMAAVGADYDDFLPRAIPTVADERVAGALKCAGAALVRRYMQLVWRREAYGDLFEHIRSVFATAAEYAAFHDKETYT